MTLDKGNAQSLIDSFAGKKVIVLGDFYLDEYVHTKAEQLSPEAPVLRTVVQSKEHMPGAAGNVAVCLRALGAEVIACGIIGADEAGEQLQEKLQESGVRTEALLLSEERRSGVFSRIMADESGGVSQHVVRVDTEHIAAPTSDDLEEMLEQLQEHLPDADAVFVADYDEADGVGVVTPEVISFVSDAESVFTAGMSREKITSFEGFDFIMCNEHEARAATSLSLAGDDFTVSAAQQLREGVGVDIVAVTLGEEGVYALGPQGSARASKRAEKVVDVCGAGDNLGTAFVLSLLAGASLGEACELGAAAGAAAVTHEGTAAVDTQELLEVLFSDSKGGEGAILSREELRSTLRKAQSEGKKVVFTNGYFDILHLGHIKFLQQASELGDIFAVAINSDSSTQANKGFDRPFINQDDRAEILASFDHIDYVTVFDELTPINILKELQPDVFVKGGDYSRDEVVGVDIMDALGKEVKVIPPQGPMTREFVESIRSSKDTIHE